MGQIGKRGFQGDFILSRSDFIFLRGDIFSRGDFIISSGRICVTAPQHPPEPGHSTGTGWEQLEFTHSEFS